MTLTLAANESNATMFQDWTIIMQGTGSYSISEESNGTWTRLLEGYSPGSYTATEIFGSAVVTVSVVLAGCNFTYRNERIVGFLTSTYVSSVEVTSTLAGSTQSLIVHPGQRGVLMFPTWTVSMESDLNVTYSIELNGKLESEGFVSGSRSISFNVTGKVASVVVSLGQKSYSFPGELIASVPLSQYFNGGPPPAPLVATAIQVLTAVGAGVMIFAVWSMVAGLTFRPWVMDRMKRKPRYR